MTQGHIIQIVLLKPFSNQNKIVLLLPINISVAVTIFNTNWVTVFLRIKIVKSYVRNLLKLPKIKTGCVFGLFFMQFQFCVAECIL